MKILVLVTPTSWIFFIIFPGVLTKSKNDWNTWEDIIFCLKNQPTDISWFHKLNIDPMQSCQPGHSGLIIEVGYASCANQTNLRPPYKHTMYSFTMVPPIEIFLSMNTTKDNWRSILFNEDKRYPVTSLILHKAEIHGNGSKISSRFASLSI